MGYVCPVCGDPQADAGHLANHLAFTAILGDDDHEAWLEANAPGWETMGEADLADEIRDDVEETEFPQVFENTVGETEREDDPLEERSGMLFEEDDHAHGSGHEHGDRPHQHDPRSEPASRGELADAPLDEEAKAILEEAREMTREMLDEDEE